MSNVGVFVDNGELNKNINKKKKPDVLLVDNGELTKNINKKKNPGVLQADRCPLCDKFYRREYFFNKHL